MEEAGDSIGIVNINRKVLNNALKLFGVLHDKTLASQDKLQQIIELLKGEDIDINFHNKYDIGNTLLHGAVSYGFDDVVKHLLERNANVNIQNTLGDTPLHISVVKGFVDIVQMLLEKGAEMNIKNLEGETPLHIAVVYGSIKIVNLFLYKKKADVSEQEAYVNVHNVDVNIQNAKGETPLHMVFSERRRKKFVKPIAQMLLGCKADVNIQNSDGKTPLDLAEETEDQNIISVFKSSRNISTQVTVNPSQYENKGCADSSIVDAKFTENQVQEISDPFIKLPYTYYSSGAKINMHGTVYQLCLLMLFAIRAVIMEYRFRLGTEVYDADKFDDLVFKYQVPNTNKLKKIYLQAIHTGNRARGITFSDLLGERRKSPFSLLKYYMSYIKLGYSKENAVDEIDFVICTNTFFNFVEPGVLIKDGKKLSFETVTGSCEEFFAEGQCYKLITDDDTLDWLIAEFDQNLNREIEKLRNDHPKELIDTLTCLNDTQNTRGLNLRSFLDKLIFAVGQRADDELVKIFLRHNSNTKNMLDIDVIMDAFYKQMFDWYSSKQGVWLSNELVSEMIRTSCKQVSNFASSRSQAYAEKLRTSPIKFNISKLDELNELIHGNKIVHLETPVETKLTLLQVAQTLEHSLSYKANDSFIFMHLSSLLLTETQKQTIREFQSPHINDLLVIDCLSKNEDVSSRERTTLRDRLLQILDNNDRKKIILIAPEKHWLAEMFTSHHGYYSQKAENIFYDFTTKTQDIFLKTKVTFQGQRMELNQVIDKKEIDILKIVPIETLIADEGLIIGQEQQTSNGYKESNYIERYLRYQTVIKADLFHSKSREKFNDEIATTEPEFQHLCALHPMKNIHLIEKQVDRFIWVKSQGELSALRPYVDNEHTQACPEELFVDSVEVQRIVIISDSAGMGKSTVLDHISKKIKDKCWGSFVLRIDLNEHTKLLKKQSTISSKHFSAKEFLFALSLMKTPLERTLLVQNRKAVLIFDGFDEICPDYKEIVLDLVQHLKEVTEAQIWITTRSYMKEELENAFNTFSNTLEPFSKKDQVDFLIKYWKNQREINNPDEGGIRAFALSLISLLATSISDKEREFTGIPLQMRMLAECFVDDFGKPADFENDFSLVDLYERFSSKKFLIYHTEKNGIDVTKVRNLHNEINNLYMKQHRWYALSVIFSEETANTLIPNYIRSDDIESSLNIIGIVSIINGVPHFIHRTYAEFIVAFYCMKLLKTMDSLKPEVQDFILSDLLVSNNLTVIRSFIDGLFARNKCTSSASRKPSNQIAPFSKALVNNKIEEIKKIFLQTAEEGNLHVFNFLLDCVVAQQEILRKFLECTESNSNKTMLHLAAENNNTRFVEKFLNWTHDNMELGQEILKVTLSAVDYVGNTALLSASWKRNNDVVYSLLQWTHQNKALGQDIVKQMLLSADITGNTALLVASERGNLTMVTTLLQWTLDNMDQGQEILEKMLLSFDSLQGHKSLQAASWLGNNDVVKTLLQWTRYKLKNGQGLVNQMLLSPDNNGIVALMAASRQGNNDVVQTLLQWTCSNMDDGQIIVKQMLLKPDNNDITALLAASRHGNIDVVLELLQWSFDNLDQGPNVVKEMLLKSDKNGITALVAASTQKHYDVVQRLLQWAHDKMSQEVVEQMLFSADNNGVTTFLAASKQSNKDEVQTLLQWTNDKMQQGQEIVRQMLLSADSNGDTALLSAASLGNNDVVQTLLQWTLGNRNQGQDLVKQMLLSTNNNGLTALLAASGQGNNDVVQTIMQWTRDHMTQGHEIIKQMLIKVKK